MDVDILIFVKLVSITLKLTVALINYDGIFRKNIQQNQIHNHTVLLHESEFAYEILPHQKPSKTKKLNFLNIYSMMQFPLGIAFLFSCKK